MATNTVTPNKAKVIWLATEEAGTPYPHAVEGECDCNSCKNKTSIIVMAQ
jgi:hypothetical protein